MGSSACALHCACKCVDKCSEETLAKEIMVVTSGEWGVKSFVDLALVFLQGKSTSIYS